MRVYKLQPEPHYSIYTGTSPDNLQYIICLVSDLLLFIEFSPEGTIIKSFTEKHDGLMNRNVFDSMANKWIKELSLKIQPIEVKKFRIEEPGLEIRDLPSELENFQNDKDFVLEQDREEYENDIKGWYEREEYVLIFESGYSDLWIDKEGFVIGS